MNAKLCDRCGKEVKPTDEIMSRYWRYNVIVDNWPYAGHSNVDLCDNCKKDLYKFITEYKKETI